MLVLEPKAILAKNESFAKGSPTRATTTTAASGGNREELLGQRPAGRECKTLHEADAGSRNPDAVTAKLVTERLYKAELNRYQKSSPVRGSWENYMGVKPFSTAASHPCPAHRGRCARQWCSRSAAGPHCTRRWGTWRAGRRGSASRAACPRRHRSRSPP